MNNENDECSLVEKIIAGEEDIKNYNLYSTFDGDEIRQLIEADIIDALDLPDYYASDLMIDGEMALEEYPFEKLTPHEQIRLLENDVVTKDEFLAKAKLNQYEADDWLFLLQVCPEMDSMADWDMLRKEGWTGRWLAFLAERPDCADKADWNKLSAPEYHQDFLEMLESQPDLYSYCTDKGSLLAADSEYWVELLIKQPKFAEIYPVEDLDDVDEVEYLLRYQPQFAKQITWNPGNEPVKLFITNENPEKFKTLPPDMDKFIPADISPVLKPILQKTFYLNKWEANRYANLIGHNEVTFVGIYGSQSADDMIKNFQMAAKTANLNLAIFKR